MNPMTVQPDKIVIIPGGRNTVTPYEYRGLTKPRRDDIFVWLEEQEKERETRCSPGNEIRS